MSESAREGRVGMWFAFALGSAVFAALTAIFAKVGIEGVDSNLATAVRTLVVLVMAWAIVLVTGASWLCYYRALQLGQASLVVPIDKLSLVITLVLAVVLLREQLTARGVVGAVLVTVGAIVMVT